ncbi:hypothetical protein BD414DRAFT_494369 [Trametes punicea]|nr:hypothetical protein BD414DRAFT_494369 [Trametes punicea]
MASSVPESNAASHPLAEIPPPPTTVTPPTTSSSTTTEAETETASNAAPPLIVHADEPPRPQAGPLPRKRGEIGFIEGVHDRGDVEAQASASARRASPADAGTASGASAGDPPRSPSPNGSTDTVGKRSLISLFKAKRVPTVGGLRTTSLALLTFQLCLFAGTITGWVLLARHMQNAHFLSSSSGTSPDPNATPATTALSETSSQIFVHVAFGITALAELIFIERSVFRLRAERYAHTHPGEVLPLTRVPQEPVSTAMAFAPWNRPPLPTYAAALAQSGVGTGDVEDNIIAIPPPPAYGNTRGSTLLLAGSMSDALRSQRSRGSVGSAVSRLGTTREEEGEEERPKSYMSVDPEWEEIQDATRALRLEETLARLEEGGGADGRSS